MKNTKKLLLLFLSFSCVIHIKAQTLFGTNLNINNTTYGNSHIPFSEDGNVYLSGKSFIYRSLINATHTTRFFIDGTTGDVGIGTTTPAGRLHLLVPASSNTTNAFTLDVSSFSTTANANASSFFRIRDLGANNYNAFVVKGNYNVGIGTEDPQALLHLRGTYYSVPYLRIGHWADANGFVGEAGGIKFYKHMDNFETVKIYMYTDWYAHGGTNYQSSDLRFATAPKYSNNAIDRMVITGDGKVGIGTNDPKGYLLAVAGSMAAESVKVKLQTNWPDFVFTPAYSLRPLAEVERHINEQGHLPEVPSATQVAKEGLDVASTDALLLRKIEELTLYLIEQNKKLEALQQQVAGVKR